MYICTSRAIKSIEHFMKDFYNKNYKPMLREIRPKEIDRDPMVIGQKDLILRYPLSLY